VTQNEGPLSASAPKADTARMTTAGAKRPFMRQVATTKLAVDHQIEHVRSRARPSIWSVVQVDQTCLGRSGGFAPVSLPLFQGNRL